MGFTRAVKKVRKTRSRKIFLLFFLIFESFSLQKYSLAADRIRPCNTDQDKSWYFSLGKAVFFISDIDSIPMQSKWLEITDINPNSALSPPDPSAPIGCKNNPQQLAYLKVPSWPKFGNYDYLHRVFPDRMPHSPDWIEIAYDPISASMRYKNGKLYKRHYSSCKDLDFKFEKRFPNGGLYCTPDSFGLNNPRNYNFTWALIIPKKLYAVPLSWDQLFFIEGAFGQPEVGYWESDFIYIAYQPNFSPFPLASLTQRALAFNQAVQSTIISLELTGYKWPSK